METQLAILIAQALIKYGPTVARELTLLFKKDKPTAEDWDRVFTLAETPYDAYVAPQAVVPIAPK